MFQKCLESDTSSPYELHNALSSVKFLKEDYRIYNYNIIEILFLETRQSLDWDQSHKPDIHNEFYENYCPKF